jgi:hypothetical protein
LRTVDRNKRLNDWTNRFETASDRGNIAVAIRT